MFHLIVTVVLTALGIGAGLGIALAIFVLLPLFLYSVPFYFWVGNQKCMGKHLDLYREKSVFRNARHASRLYKAWIRHTEPTF